MNQAGHKWGSTVSGHAALTHCETMLFLAIAIRFLVLEQKEG